MRRFLSRLLRTNEAQDGDAQGPLFAEVKRAMIEVRAYAQSHGGDIELVSVDSQGWVTVRLRGACAVCPLSSITLKLGVEARLKELVPGVNGIRAK